MEVAIERIRGEDARQPYKLMKYSGQKRGDVFRSAQSDHVYDGGNCEDTDCQHQDFGEVETRDY